MKLKLGTFNLFQFVEPPYAWYNKKSKFTPSQWQTKTRWIKAQILKMECDIIGFQEVFSRDALKDLVKEVGFNHFVTIDDAQVSIHDTQKFITTTVALASKYPIVHIETVEIDEPSLEKHLFTEAFEFSRVPIKATLHLPNEKELLVYVCHLKSNRLNEFEHIFRKEHTLEHKKELVFKTLEDGYAKALKQRLCEASSLFYDLKKSHEKPTILLCDLNDKEFSLTIDALTNPQYHDETNQEIPLLNDASYHYKEIIINPHPEQKETERKATSYFQGRGHVLDYVFISRHFRVTNYKVLDDHLEANRDGSLLQSDHAQVVCEVNF
jgi:endonuclease/exonuclease/phosphatase family metal-dependent hydrolase